MSSLFFCSVFRLFIFPMLHLGLLSAHYIYSVLSPSTPFASAYLKAKGAEGMNIKAGEKG